MDEIAIELKNVVKSFKIPKRKKENSQSNVLKALNDISFTVKKGEILGVIGNNGSGKSTLLRIIPGIYKPDHGEVIVNGRLSPVMQIGTGFMGDLPAKENIIMNGMLFGLSKHEIESKVEDIIQYAELEKFETLQIKRYSSGMKARLAFSISMQINPDIFLIDEILAVGDKNFREKSYGTFLELVKSKKTIIHVTHNLSKLKEFSDRVLLLDKGKVVMIGDPEEVIKKYQSMKSTNL